MLRFKFSVILIILLSTFSLQANSDLIGKPAPEINLIELKSNKTVMLNQLKGKVVIVDFWASWCSPCKRTLPILQSIKSKYKDIEVLTINIDEEKKNAEAFIKRFNVTLPVLYDADKKVVEKISNP